MRCHLNYSCSKLIFPSESHCHPYNISKEREKNPLNESLCLSHIVFTVLKSFHLRSIHLPDSKRSVCVCVSVRESNFLPPCMNSHRGQQNSECSLILLDFTASTPVRRRPTSIPVFYALNADISHFFFQFLESGEARFCLTLVLQTR